MYQTQVKFSGNLHALRGLAALSVVFFHARGLSPNFATGWMEFVRHFGTGVTLFFILSGFSLSLSNFDKISAPDWLRGYTIKRIARIIPVWYTFIAITWLYHYFKFGMKLPAQTVINQVLPFYSIIPGRAEGMVWAGWTIGVELMFYAIFPLMLVILRDNVKAWCVALIGFLAVSISIYAYVPSEVDPASLYISFPRQAFVFVLGATFYFATRRAQSLGRERGFALFMLAVSIVGFVLWACYDKNVWRPAYYYFLPMKAMALGALTVFAYINPKFGKLPQFNLYNSVTRFLGDKSYTIYLAHPIVVAETKRFQEPLSGLIPNEGLAFLAYCAILIGITCIIATVISTLIEAPLYKRGRAIALAGISQAAGTKTSAS